MDLSQEKRELEVAILAIVAGEATPEQRARVEHLVTTSEPLALFAVELLHQEAWISQHYSEQPGYQNLEARLDQAGAMPPVPISGTTGLKPVGRGAGAGGAGWRGPWLAAAALLIVGGMAGSLLTQWMGSTAGDARPVAKERAGDGAATEGQTLYAARFVGDTACVWESGRTPLAVRAGNIRSGESFNLMEGVAEIELTGETAGQATLLMEGPARMILTARGMPSLMQGRFTTRLQPGRSEVVLDMPYGQIRVRDEATLGVAINGLDVEVHVVSGEIAVECPWLADDTATSPIRVESGGCLRFGAEDDRTVMEQDAAKPWQFATLTSMDADQLLVPSEYIAAVLDAQPLVYWRFEVDSDGVTRNEVSDRFHGVIHGEPLWSQQGTNRAIDLGSAASPDALHTFLQSSDAFGSELQDGYSIELWVKPSHYHLGSLVALLRGPDEHGALVEMGGPLSTPSIIERGGKFRFLHRDPPGEAPELGTSCFSQNPYEARRWAHVVAVKDSAEIRLFVNGKMVGSANDASGLAEGLTLLVAQLDAERHIRPFVGQLDELAVYPHPLDAKTVAQHFELMRPREAQGDTI